MSSEVQIVLTAVDKASSVLNNTGQQSGKLATNLLAAAKAAGVATLAYKGFDILKTVVNDTVAYAEQVRDLSRALGINAEESSKLIQIADDLKIDQTQLAMAFRYAINKGIDPSIDGLKELQDEYHQIQDPIEKARFAMENFGTRGGLEMQKVLELTGDELDEMAKSAEMAGLVLSDEAAQSARDFEIAMDGLNDTAEGLKITLGNALIPVITDLADEINGLVTDNLTLTDAIDSTTQAVKLGIITEEEQMAMLRRMQEAQGDMTEVNKIASDVELALRDDRREGILAMEDATGAADDLESATEELTAAEDGHTSALDLAISAIKESNVGMKAKIALERELKLLTGELTQEELDMEEALGFLTKQLELGNIQQEEYIALVQQLNADATLANEVIKGLGNAILLLPDSKDIHINVKYHKYGPEPGPDVPVIVPEEPYVPGPGGQFGLHGIVPPGYPNDTYNIRASSGERVDITPQNQINNYSLTINEAGSRGNVVMDFALLQALARG